MFTKNERERKGGGMKVKEVIRQLASEYDVPVELCGHLFAVAFASYLHREKRRHEKDIANINVDLKIFARKDINPIFIPLETWTDVNEIP
jgi:hypothetical protein